MGPDYLPILPITLPVALGECVPKIWKRAKYGAFTSYMVAARGHTYCSSGYVLDLFR